MTTIVPQGTSEINTTRTTVSGYKINHLKETISQIKSVSFHGSSKKFFHPLKKSIEYMD